MGDIIELGDYKPHIVHEVICIKCCHRWIAVAPENLWLKDYACPSCQQTGGVIKTGQSITE